MDETDLNSRVQSHQANEDPMETLSSLVEELGSTKVVESITSTYLDLLDERVESVRQAWPDPFEVANAAHLLRGASAIVGATDLAAATAEIESAGRSGNLVNEALLDRLDHLASCTADMLERALEQLGDPP